jgi:hypothetical protein
MAWTTPQTWTAGSVVSASQLNEQLRDNLSYLLSRPHQRIARTAASDYTTASAAFVDIDSVNLSITLTIASGAVLVGFSGVAQFDGGGSVRPAFDLAVDGVRHTTAADGLISLDGLSGALWLPVTFTALAVGLTVGAHVFRPVWRNVGTGAATLRAVSNPVCFWAMEVA